MLQHVVAHWQAWVALGTLIATWIYVILTFAAVLYAASQYKEVRNERKREAALSAFRELQTKEARNARKYIYEKVPLNLSGLNDQQLQEHLEMAEEAILAFERIGYLLIAGHIDPEPILVNHWPVIWKCWKKTSGLIVWGRAKRGHVTYVDHFDRLFKTAEAYRVRNGFPEPQFY